MNINYNYRDDLKNKNDDPDRLSFNLKLTHEQLWSKPLPNGAVLKLKAAKDKIEGYLNGELAFLFNPDSFVNTLSNSERMGYKKIVERWRTLDNRIDDELNKYYSQGYTIGESIIFPIQDDNGKSTYTINKARGMHPFVQDRSDLTLECIKRYYFNEESPLSNCFKSYSAFFALFGNGEKGFENYVKWFCLDDLVSSDYKEVLPFTKFLNFKHPQPENEEEYLIYVKSVNSFVDKRNERLLAEYPDVFEKETR